MKMKVQIIENKNYHILQDQINEWLERWEGHKQVIDIKYSSCGSVPFNGIWDYSAMIIYKENREMRIDCSKTLNYVKELNRMCKYYGEQDCKECPLKNIPHASSFDIAPKQIDIVQKWSDEHPQETMAEHFFNMFPNAQRELDGTPRICTQNLGWDKEKCPKDIASCRECWNRPYKGE